MSHPSISVVVGMSSADENDNLADQENREGGGNSSRAIFWNFLKEHWRGVLVALVSIPGAILAIMQIVAMINAQAGPLVTAIAEINAFSLPDEVAIERWGLDGVRSTDELEPENGTHELKPESTLETLIKCNEFTTIIMVNNGREIAKGVRLQAGGTGLAIIDWDDGKREVRLFTTDIELGELPIAKEVKVSVWRDMKFPISSNREIKVIHDTDEVVARVPSRESRLGFPMYLLMFTLALSIGYFTFTALRLDCLNKKFASEYDEHVAVVNEGRRKIEEREAAFQKQEVELKKIQLELIDILRDEKISQMAAKQSRQEAIKRHRIEGGGDPKNRDEEDG